MLASNQGQRYHSNYIKILYKSKRGTNQILEKLKFVFIEKLYEGEQL